MEYYLIEISPGYGFYGNRSSFPTTERQAMRNHRREVSIQFLVQKMSLLGLCFAKEIFCTFCSGTACDPGQLGDTNLCPNGEEVSPESRTVIFANGD